MEEWIVVGMLCLAGQCYAIEDTWGPYDTLDKCADRRREITKMIVQNAIATGQQDRFTLVTDCRKKEVGVGA